MISRRLLEFAKRPLSGLQSFFRDPTLAYQRASPITSEESIDNSYQKQQHDDKDKEKDDFKDEEEHYQQDNSYGRYIHFGSLLPLFAIMTHKLNSVSCFFSTSKFEKDKVTNRVALIQYPSNNPIEDRWSVGQLEALPGFVTMVFDGHGGWQVAEHAKKTLALEVDNALKANKEKTFASEDEYIMTSLKEAFDKVENEFLQVAREAYNIGYAGIGKVGACALVTLVTGNKVYVANAGDCQAVICRNESAGKVVIRKLNSKLNANSKKEQKRLREQFSDEDIVHCKRGDNKACYVKKRLQPTRAFGDFHLKHPEFNNPKNLGPEYGYRSQLEKFNGPYITHEPVIKVFEIDRNDKYLVLSSDGMWDELSKDDVAKIAEKNLGDKEKFTQDLLGSAIQVAAKRRDITEAEIKKVPLGHRRSYHDDMTIIVVDLENQRR